ncbi:hypothetical protein [Caulobacter sp. B11]|uniref:hypothetical protein n=1 Tax=Caulobacter sp. B11 TaxID=2048899 RepID=UPI001180D869|nr:hypothetical protein [Caulobacter sp. B11]
MTQRRQDSLLANLPESFSADLTTLRRDYMHHHGAVAICSARLEYFLGVAVNNIAFMDASLLPDRKFPFKFSARLKWLRDAFSGSSRLATLRSQASAIFDELERLNSARNEILHSALLAHGPGDGLYVARVVTDRGGTTLSLEEGEGWNVAAVVAVATELAEIEGKLLQLIKGVRLACSEP